MNIYQFNFPVYFFLSNNIKIVNEKKQTNKYRVYRNLFFVPDKINYYNVIVV